jgi:hypothetical protein
MKTIKLYNGEVTILFDEGRHRFFHVDGSSIKGVTSYTGVLDKPALVPWAVKMMGIYLYKNWDIKKVKTEAAKANLIETAKREFRRIKEEAAEKGKEAHAWAEDWTKGKKPKMPEDPETRNAVIAFLDWFKQSGIKITSQERFIYSKKYNYAGIMDWEGKRSKSLIIGDYKATNAIYDEMRFQLALYWNAREEETGKQYEEGDIIQFGKQTAEFGKLVIPRKEYLKDLKSALGCVTIKNRLNELRYGKL